MEHFCGVLQKDVVLLATKWIFLLWKVDKQTFKLENWIFSAKKESDWRTKVDFHWAKALTRGPMVSFPRHFSMLESLCSRMQEACFYYFFFATMLKTYKSGHEVFTTSYNWPCCLRKKSRDDRIVASLFAFGFIQASKILSFISTDYCNRIGLLDCIKNGRYCNSLSYVAWEGESHVKILWKAKSLVSVEAYFWITARTWRDVTNWKT